MTDAEAAQAVQGVLPDERIRRRNDLILEDLIETKLVDAVADHAQHFSHRIENSLAC